MSDTAAPRIDPERLIETTIGLWPNDDPPGQRPPRLAAAIVKELRDEGYSVVPTAQLQAVALAAAEGIDRASK